MKNAAIVQEMDRRGDLDEPLQQERFFLRTSDAPILPHFLDVSVCVWGMWLRYIRCRRGKRYKYREIALILDNILITSIKE